MVEIQKQTRLLAIDSATEFCSVAYTDGKRLLVRGSEAPRQHADLLLPYVQDVLAEAEVSLADIDAIVVGHGPGSFTGVRIAAGIAQGLAFSQQIPLIGVSSLAAMAQQCVRLHGAEAVAVAIDARMGEVYFGTYVAQQGLMVKQGEEQVAAPTALAPLPAVPQQWFTAGTGFDTYAEQLMAQLTGAEQKISGAELHGDKREEKVKLVASSVRFPHAEDMLTLGLQAFLQGGGVAAEAFDVRYVRNEVTWQKLPGRS